MKRLEMKIIKILNNNVVISEENQEEIVLMGRGLAFGRKAGQEIPLDLIEKKFILSADRNQLINEIDPEIIEIAGEVIAFAHKKISKKLNHHAFIAMADHMHGVVLREKDDIYLKNFLMWDIKRFFPEEFEVGKYANQLLSQYFGKDLPDDEAGFMALTIVNAELENGAAARDLTMLMEEIMTIVKYSLEISLDEEDIYVQRFVTHLKFFCERVLTGSGYRDLEDNEMFMMMKSKYPYAFETTQKIVGHLEKTRNYITSEDEQLYLIIHLSRVKRKLP